MTARDLRRADLVSAMADHLLAHGLAGASLRPMARAAGTSDRMLLYYFADRDEVLGATLDHLAARLAGLLDAALPDPAPRPFARLLAEAWAVMGAPEGRPYMRIWLELVAQAAGGAEPHRAIAATIFQGFLDWVEARLAIADAADRRDAARLLLTAVEGMMVADAAGARDAADAAARRLARLAAAQG